MVAAAQRETGAAAQGTQEVPASPDESTAGVDLSPPLSCLARIPASWEDVARQQIDIDEDALRQSKTGDYFAMDDRNLLSMPWRRVFIVRDGHHFIVYDSHGFMIHEPSDGVEAGRQPVDSLINEFDVGGMWFYRQGKIRKSPSCDRQQQSMLEPEPLSFNDRVDQATARAGTTAESEARERMGDTASHEPPDASELPPQIGSLMSTLSDSQTATLASEHFSTSPALTLLGDSCKRRQGRSHRRTLVHSIDPLPCVMSRRLRRF